MKREIGSFDPIVEACRDQANHIDAVVWEAGRSGGVNISNCHTFTPCHAAFAQAIAIIKRSGERQRLVAQPLPADQMPDSVSRQLAVLLNSTVGYVEQIDPHFSRPNVPWEIAACSSAEKLFSPVIEDLKKSVKTCARIVMVEDEAVVLQKTADFGAMSGLTLQEMTIGKSRYPAGTLVRLPNVLPMSGRRGDIIEAHDVAWLEPMRLTAFAASPDERTGMLSHFKGYNSAPFVLRDMAIDDIAAKVTSVALSAELQST